MDEPRTADARDAASPPGVPMKGRKTLWLVVVVGLVASVVAWVATEAIESPREAAASAQAPPPSLITALVEQRVVGDEVITRGTVAATESVEAITSLAGRAAQRAVISGHVPTPGRKVAAGDVIVEISGRPILAFKSVVPTYRDLRLGDQGPDVRRLNSGLEQMGFKVSQRSSDYSVATQTAVRALYRRAGYPPVGEGDLPSSEVVNFSQLPGAVISTNARLGADASKTSVQIAAGPLVVTATLPADRMGLVRAGTKLVLSSEILGESVDATVSTEVVSQSGAAETSATPGQTIVINPARPLPNSWAGQDVRVRVVGAQTPTKVLAVPITAVVMNASGETEVVVVDHNATSVADAHPERVPIKVGVVGGGWAEITPTKTTLQPGDAVQLSAPTGSG